MIIDKLLNTNPFDFSSENKELFLQSLQETCRHHYEHNDFFNFIYQKNSYTANDIKDEKSLSEMPYIMVNTFKHYELISGKKENIVLSLGSSGTTGQRSMIYLDQGSLDRVKKLAFNIHESLGITSSKKYNYLCFTYDPQIANDLGTAFTDELLTSFTNKAEVYYTFQDHGSGFEYDEQKVIDKLIEFEASPYSTRILGFPAFLYELIVKHDLKLNLGKDSWVQTGGGWKNHSDKEIPKADFRLLISEALGIPIGNIRDLFGMVEHGIPYVDCAEGFLRIPNYARVLIRDPRTMAVLPYGEIGLIQFICSYNTSFPAPSLLTTDYGSVVQSSKGDILNIHGRAGNIKHKGCAIQAMEKLL